MTATALRPLTLGELLDRTFSYYREHFLLFVGIMAMPQAVMVGVSLLLQSLRVLNPASPRPSPDPSQAAAQFAAVLSAVFIYLAVVTLASLLVYSVAHGATASALAGVYLGQTASVSGAYRSLRGKIWRLLDAVLSIILRIMAAYILIGVASALFVVLPVAALGLFPGKTDPLLAVAVGFLFLIVILVALFFGTVLMMRYALTIPALILENLRARDAIKRSVLLAKGNLWRIFLIFVLMYIIAMAVVAIFQGPFYVAIVVIGAQHGAMPLWLAVPMTIAGGIGGALSGPLMVIALTLLYYDARVRKEGFDLQHMMASLDPGTSGASAPAATVPLTPSGT